LGKFQSPLEIYKHHDPTFDGRPTVPILFDKKTMKIVNNESSEIMRMINSNFQKLAKNPDLDIFPKELESEIMTMNEEIYHKINNGVYKTGFS